MKKEQELTVITKTYDLILWSCHHTSRFPRNHRFVLGERIERNLYDLLETLIRAKYTRRRHELLEPIYERTFIADSYAYRKGKGTHAAVRRCQHFARRFRHVLKSDVQKCFPSLNYEILKALVARKIKDRDVLWLVGQIIDGSNPQEEVVNYFPGDDLFTPGERRGIPIGNQTSQFFFANVYLDPLDHFIKDCLGIKGPQLWPHLRPRYGHP
jgi:hypothetical protein